MTADVITRAPVRRELADLAYSAAEYRKAQLEGCCWPEEPCADHAPAMAMTRKLLVAAIHVKCACCDETAMEAIRSLKPPVLAEVLGATTDASLIAAIEGGTTGGSE